MIASLAQEITIGGKKRRERWDERTCCGQVGDATQAELREKEPAACCGELLQYRGRVVVCG
jgi:hypothetical protein